MPDRSCIVGCSPWAQRIRDEIRRVACHAATVLITGPSGTGKELIARSIHAQSPRNQAPFVPIDCASASGTLFTSQLFGHEKGAFTGAVHASLGAFRAADGGTIFLDEMGELEPELQANLLRVLQERTVVPLGSVEPVPVDVRVVAATNRDLTVEVEQGRFREDLYYRINVVNLHATPIVSRREDLDLLIDYLQSRMEIRYGIPRKPISPIARALLQAHDWPGNVRELDNVLERAHLYCDGPYIQPEHLPGQIADYRRVMERVPMEDAPPNTTVPLSWPTMADVERNHLRASLERTNYNQTEASQLLGLDRHALRRLAHRLGVDLSRSRPGRPAKEMEMTINSWAGTNRIRD